jgi:hypothetical protein
LTTNDFIDDELDSEDVSEKWDSASLPDSVPLESEEERAAGEEDVQAVGQVKGWKVQQIVFVGGTCGSIHVESFNRNIKALGGLERQ